MWVWTSTNPGLTMWPSASIRLDAPLAGEVADGGDHPRRSPRRRPVRPVVRSIDNRSVLDHQVYIVYLRSARRCHDRRTVRMPARIGAGRQRAPRSLRGPMVWRWSDSIHPPPSDMPIGEAMFTQRAIRRLDPTGRCRPTSSSSSWTLPRRRPTAGNAQVGRFLVLTDRATIEAFGALYHERGGRSGPTSSGGRSTT